MIRATTKTVCFKAAAFAFVATNVLGAETDSFYIFPETKPDREKAAFCVTVTTATDNAMDKAASQIPNVGQMRGSFAPNWIVHVIGGQAEYDIAVSNSKQWTPHVTSLSQTYFYPMMKGDGARYTEYEGQLLLSAFKRCLSFFEQVKDQS